MSKKRRNKPYHNHYMFKRKKAKASEIVTEPIGGVEFSSAFANISDKDFIKHINQAHDDSNYISDKYEHTLKEIAEIISAPFINSEDPDLVIGLESALNLYTDKHISRLKELCAKLKDEGVSLTAVPKEINPMVSFPIEFIALKAEGNCFVNPLKYVKLTYLYLPVITCNSYVFCPELDIYFDKTEQELLEMLYKHNESLRIDRTLSLFSGFPDPSDKYITNEMMEYLCTREGMLKTKFQELKL